MVKITLLFVFAKIWEQFGICARTGRYSLLALAGGNLRGISRLLLNLMVFESLKSSNSSVKRPEATRQLRSKRKET